jgi:CheY-like chemotaxis protein
MLVKRGYKVRTAENGEEAMKRLAEAKPDLILMDVVMPGQNGFQLTRAITRDERYAGVPVIMCTSKNQETDKVWGMRQGAATTSSSRSRPKSCWPRSRPSAEAAWRTRPPCASSSSAWPSACRPRASRR